jgi:beta-glucosidase
MLALASGIQAVAKRLDEVDPEIVVYHVDATDLYETEDPALEEEAERRNQIVFLALDLVGGRVGDRHPLRHWLAAHGAPDSALESIIRGAAPPQVIGLNLYPMFSRKKLFRNRRGRLRIKMPYSEEGLIDQVANRYFARFGVPMMISEAATSGSVERRLRWLQRSAESLARLRARGVPIVGYTWWPMFALVTWAWRQGSRDVSSHLLQMGLWNLDEHLDRIRTPVVDAYCRLALSGCETVGRLAPRAT